MERKNEKDNSPPKTTRPRQTAQRIEGSDQDQPPHRFQPPSSLPPYQGSHSRGAPVGGMPPANLHPIPVDGSAGEGVSIVGLDPQGTSRKGVTDITDQGPAAVAARYDELPFQCYLCRKRFQSDKSLFRHMRTHRPGGWRSALFTRLGFADQEEQEDDQSIPRLEVTPPAVVEGEGGMRAGAEEATNANDEQYSLPDLNLTPPRDDDGWRRQ